MDCHFNLMGCRVTGGPFITLYASTNLLYSMPYHVEDKAQQGGKRRLVDQPPQNYLPNPGKQIRLD